MTTPTTATFGRLEVILGKIQHFATIHKLLKLYTFPIYQDMNPLYQRLVDKPGAYRAKVPVTLSETSVDALQIIQTILTNNIPHAPNLFGHAPWEAVKAYPYDVLTTDASGSTGLGASFQHHTL